jgi:hypothetical protein
VRKGASAPMSLLDAVDGAHPAAVNRIRFDRRKRRAYDMKTVVTVGLDIAKNVYQAHGIDAEGGVIFRKRLSRAKVEECQTTP